MEDGVMVALLDGQELYEEHRFTNALPIPDVIDATNGRTVTLQVRQTTQFLGLYEADGDPLYTTVWGYGTGAGNTSYPGPTILATEGTPITVNWQNKLPLKGHLLPVDISLDFANSDTHPLSDGYVPIVTHLHGGHNDSIFDGLPDQWFTQTRGGPNGPRGVGDKFVTSSMTYDNSQDAATLWYHDHALGITRLNVYAGLAGFYVLQDQTRLSLVEDGVLPSGEYDIGMAIQDRAFKSDGQLYYPAYDGDPLPGPSDESVDSPFGDEVPTVVPEFFGDIIMVNGMAWPTLDVAAADETGGSFYSFRLLNGSDSRFYVLRVDDPDVGMYLVGTDGGLLPRVEIISDGNGEYENEFLVLAPGDRVEVIFDFSNLEDGQRVNLLNIGPAFEPFKGVDKNGQLLGDDPFTPEDEAPVAAGPEDSVGNIMQFVVTESIEPFQAADALFNRPLVENFEYLALDIDENGVADTLTFPSDPPRKLGLFEGVDEYGRVTPMLGTAEAAEDGLFGPLSFHAPTTEILSLGETEQWDIFNFTADSHPIHLHLTQFQVVEKREIDFLDADPDGPEGPLGPDGIPDDNPANGVGISYGYLDDLPFPVPDYSVADIWIGDVVELRPEETGWQDTAWVDPNQMMSIVATFDKPGEYVWHCHILSHEDNEMMRPFLVVPPDSDLLFA